MENLLTIYYAEDNRREFYVDGKIEGEVLEGDVKRAFALHVSDLISNSAMKRKKKYTYVDHNFNVDDAFGFVAAEKVLLIDGSTSLFLSTEPVRAAVKFNRNKTRT